MASNDLTVNQATDLAKHFLGSEWRALNPYPSAYSLYVPASDRIWVNTSWRDVFRAAGVKLPSRPRFADHGHQVVMGDEWIATTRSSTMAKRITNALNQYEPNSRSK